ncbi:MAG: hypothetical protein EON54_10775 [Alcaligenaceae bacterium]|nr:MAG: hypothetical protein EON54_10775 [Alcaligenaceae bacterium]
MTESSVKIAAAAAAHQGTAGWSPDLVLWLAGMVLVFALCTLVLSAFVLHRTSSSTQVGSVFGIIIIVTLSAVLVIVGYSHEQLTPVIGLFGAIAGYLAGKEQPSKSPAQPAAAIPPPAP